jgi:archaellum component FlaC
VIISHLNGRRLDMIFKGFNLGKLIDNKKGKKRGSDDAIRPIADLEERLKDRTNNLKRTEQKLMNLSDKVDDIAEIEATEIRPHGPIEELSIEPEDALNGVDSDTEVVDPGAALKEDEEEIKLVEVPAESKPASKAENKPKDDYDAESLKALFTNVDEDENPLANLINSLPEVTIDELEEDLKEIRDIIRDWQQK